MTISFSIAHGVWDANFVEQQGTEFPRVLLQIRSENGSVGVDISMRPDQADNLATEVRQLLLKWRPQ